MWKLNQNDLKSNLWIVSWRCSQIFWNQLEVWKTIHKAPKLSLNFEKNDKKGILIQVYKTTCRKSEYYQWHLNHDD